MKINVLANYVPNYDLLIFVLTVDKYEVGFCFKLNI